jgi:hypothetical protein
MGWCRARKPQPAFLDTVRTSKRSQGNRVSRERLSHCVLLIWTRATCPRREPPRSDKAACLASQKYRGPGKLGRSVGVPPSAQLGGRSPRHFVTVFIFLNRTPRSENGFVTLAASSFRALLSIRIAQLHHQSSQTEVTDSNDHLT